MHLVSQKKSPKSVRRSHHWRSLIRNTVVVEHLACRAVARIQASGEQFRNAFMQIFIYWPALVLSLRAIAAVISTNMELIAPNILLVNSSPFVSWVP